MRVRLARLLVRDRRMRIGGAGRRPTGQKYPKAVSMVHRATRLAKTRPGRAGRGHVPAVVGLGVSNCRAPRFTRQDRDPGHRRLGAGQAQRQEPPRPARDHRGPPRRALHKKAEKLAVLESKEKTGKEAKQPASGAVRDKKHKPTQEVAHQEVSQGTTKCDGQQVRPRPPPKPE